METEFDGVWAVVFKEGKTYLGKIKTARISGVFSTVVDRDTVHDADILELNPAFDFFSPIRPVQRGQEVGFARDPIVTPFDFTMHDVPVYVRPGAIAFLDEMHEDDKKMYQTFIKQADKTRMEARVKRTGLTLVGADGKPNTPRR